MALDQKQELDLRVQAIQEVLAEELQRYCNVDGSLNVAAFIAAFSNLDAVLSDSVELEHYTLENPPVLLPPYLQQAGKPPQVVQSLSKSIQFALQQAGQKNPITRGSMAGCSAITNHALVAFLKNPLSIARYLAFTGLPVLCTNLPVGHPYYQVTFDFADQQAMQAVQTHFAQNGGKPTLITNGAIYDIQQALDTVLSKKIKAKIEALEAKRKAAQVQADMAEKEANAQKMKELQSAKEDFKSLISVGRSHAASVYVSKIEELIPFLEGEEKREIVGLLVQVLRDVGMHQKALGYAELLKKISLKTQKITLQMDKLISRIKRDCVWEQKENEGKQRVREDAFTFAKKALQDVGLGDGLDVPGLKATKNPAEIATRAQAEAPQLAEKVRNLQLSVEEIADLCDIFENACYPQKDFVKGFGKEVPALQADILAAIQVRYDAVMLQFPMPAEEKEAEAFPEPSAEKCIRFFLEARKNHLLKRNPQARSDMANAFAYMPEDFLDTHQELAAVIEIQGAVVRNEEIEDDMKLLGGPFSLMEYFERRAAAGKPIPEGERNRIVQGIMDAEARLTCCNSLLYEKAAPLNLRTRVLNQLVKMKSLLGKFDAVYAVTITEARKQEKDRNEKNLGPGGFPFWVETTIAAAQYLNTLPQNIPLRREQWKKMTADAGKKMIELTAVPPSDDRNFGQLVYAVRVWQGPESEVMLNSSEELPALLYRALRDGEPIEEIFQLLKQLKSLSKVNEYVLLKLAEQAITRMSGSENARDCALCEQLLAELEAELQKRPAFKGCSILHVLAVFQSRGKEKEDTWKQMLALKERAFEHGIDDGKGFFEYTTLIYESLVGYASNLHEFRASPLKSCLLGLQHLLVCAEQEPSQLEEDLRAMLPIAGNDNYPKFDIFLAALKKLRGLKDNNPAVWRERFVQVPNAANTLDAFIKHIEAFRFKAWSMLAVSAAPAPLAGPQQAGPAPFEEKDAQGEHPAYPFVQYGMKWDVQRVATQLIVRRKAIITKDDLSALACGLENRAQCKEDWRAYLQAEGHHARANKIVAALQNAYCVPGLDGKADAIFPQAIALIREVELEIRKSRGPVLAAQDNLPYPYIDHSGQKVNAKELYGNLRSFFAISGSSKKGEAMDVYAPVIVGALRHGVANMLYFQQDLYETFYGREKIAGADPSKFLQYLEGVKNHWPLLPEDQAELTQLLGQLGVMMQDIARSSAVHPAPAPRVVEAAAQQGFLPQPQKAPENAVYPFVDEHGQRWDVQKIYARLVFMGTQGAASEPCILVLEYNLSPTNRDQFKADVRAYENKPLEGRAFAALESLIRKRIGGGEHLPAYQQMRELMQEVRAEKQAMALPQQAAEQAYRR